MFFPSIRFGLLPPGSPKLVNRLPSSFVHNMADNIYLCNFTDVMKHLAHISDKNNGHHYVSPSRVISQTYVAVAQAEFLLPVFTN